MLPKTSIWNTAAMLPVRFSQRAGLVQQVTGAIAVVFIIFLALYNLTGYPLTWFDEGSHLHVPKTLVRFGVYADYSSEGFRYYGPTIGVGPTVMLPIAGVFRLFGIGLLQARLVMALYLLAAVYAFYRLAHILGGRQLAWVATALLITSPGVDLLQYGRQVLGEVPGLFFLVAGLGLWFVKWEQVGQHPFGTGWRRLGLVGLLLGLAAVTKYQYLLFLAPTLALAWLVNLVYYRTAPQRVFVVPGLVAATCFALWQIYMILYLGSATAAQNLTALREASAGAALTFSPELIQASLKMLIGLPTYMGSLLPALIYGFLLALPRRREGQQWGTLLILVMTNLVWYVVASIGWPRYAFLGLALASLFVARLFGDLIHGIQLSLVTLWKNRSASLWDLHQGESIARNLALRWVMLFWLVAMLVVPFGKSLWEIVSPDFNAPQAMAAYLTEHVPHAALIETWEPEMGFLTDHNYHFPPNPLLVKAVNHAFLNGPSVADAYRFVQTEQPEYVLVGQFGRWVGIYPPHLLAAHYNSVTSIGAYELYIRAR